MDRDIVVLVDAVDSEVEGRLGVESAVVTGMEVRAVAQLGVVRLLVRIHSTTRSRGYMPNMHRSILKPKKCGRMMKELYSRKANVLIV